MQTKPTEIELFVPCFIDQLYPDTAFSVVKVLERAGVKVHYNKKQTCCGQPSFNAGYWKKTLPLAQKFMNIVDTNRPVVGPSASCLGFVKNYYPKLSADVAFREQHERLKPLLYELTDFLVNVLDVTNFDATFAHKVTYHDACAALREYGIKAEPRKLLANVKGLELIEMQHTDVCCGFGGTFSVKHSAISSAMAQQKVQNALNTGAEYIVSTEASCLMNLQGYINKHQLPIKTIHIADILARF